MAIPRYQKTLKDSFWQAFVTTMKRNDELDMEFHFAALTNKLWRAEYLLSEKKVNVNSGDGFAIRFAVESGHDDMVKLLIEYKADVNAKEGDALIRAAALGRTEIALDLIDAGADAGLRDCRALRLADAKNDFRMVSAMLRRGRGLEKGVNELLEAAQKSGDAKKVAVYREYLAGETAKRAPQRPKLQGGPFRPK
jgi:hypothetical protein